MHSGDARVASSRRASASCATLLERIEDSADRRHPARGLPARARSRSRTSSSRHAAHGVACWATRVHERKFAFPPGAWARRADDRDGARPRTRTWRPSLAVTGAGGLPDASQTRETCSVPGPTLQPLSAHALRPSTPDDRHATAVQAILEADPPYGARGGLRRRRRAPAAGTLRRSPPGSRPRSTESLTGTGSVGAGGLDGRRRARSPSWACSASASPTRSSW